MPTFDIWLIKDKEYRVPAGKTYEDVFTYVIPTDWKDWLSIVAWKRLQVVPSFVRYRLYYRVEWTAPNPWVWADYSIYIIDRDGNERLVSTKTLMAGNPVAEDDKDLSDMFRGIPAPMGIHAIKLRLGGMGPGYWDYPFKVSLRVYGSWGW